MILSCKLHDFAFFTQLSELVNQNFDLPIISTFLSSTFHLFFSFLGWNKLPYLIDKNYKATDPADFCCEVAEMYRAYYCWTLDQEEGELKYLQAFY